MKKVYVFGRIFVAPWYRLWCRRIGGMENLPKPPFILASNHVSYYETMLYHCTISLSLNAKIHALVNGNYWNYFIPRLALNATEQIPIDVSKSEQSKKNNESALKNAAEYLKKGDIVMIFPEGHRSKDGRLLKAKTGIARLVSMSGVPVVPFGVIGAEKVLPKGAILPRFARCGVKIGKPMKFKKPKSKKEQEAITRKIMKEIAKLTGKTYDY
jgi:1-acyl-sn-glycerol-3-phosphate acyltransferase